MKLLILVVALAGLVIGAYCIDPTNWKEDFR